MLIRREVFERVGLARRAPTSTRSRMSSSACGRARTGFRTAVCSAGRAGVSTRAGGSIGRRSARRVYFATRNHLRARGRAGRRLPAAGPLRRRWDRRPQHGLRAEVTRQRRWSVRCSRRWSAAPGIMLRGLLWDPNRRRSIAQIASSSARSSTMRSICCRCRETTTEKYSETMKTKKMSTRMRYGRRVVDAERARGEVERIPPQREAQQRGGAQEPDQRVTPR